MRGPDEKKTMPTGFEVRFHSYCTIREEDGFPLSL